jgi:hypothetical protein
MTDSGGSTPDVTVPALTNDLLRTPQILGNKHFHDSRDCPHGARIERYADLPSAEYPRRCNWCTEHDRPTSS